MQPRRTTRHLLLTAKVSRRDLDLALGFLYQSGLSSSQNAPARGRIELRAALPAAMPARRLLRDLAVWEDRLGRPLFHQAKIKKILRGDWSRKYQRFLKPFALISTKGSHAAGLQVDPRGRLPRRLRQDTLYIEAGLAFGTGTHTTTQLAAELLSEALASRRRPAVLDVGCGSGILAMTAVRLGADRVVAVDNDPEALVTAKENLRRNKIRGVALRADLRGLKGKFPVIVSNIGLNVLLELRPRLLARLARSGTLILTGLLYRDVEELLRAYRGLACQTRIHRRGWAAVVLSHPAAGK